MLLTDVNEFNWSVDNFGSTFTDTALGTSVTSGTSNTKGTAVSLISGASVTEDCYELTVQFVGGAVSSATRTFLADILIDESGGSTWTTKISNLLVCSTHLYLGGYRYVFPIYVKAGTSIGVQIQCNTSSIAIRCGVKLRGKPTYPQLMKVGYRVETFGANTGTTLGTELTGGASQDKGDYVSLGTTTNDNWYWQIGTSVADAIAGASFAYFFDLAAGDVTNKKMCMENSMFQRDNSERSGRPDAFGDYIPIKKIKAGEDVYARVAFTLAADSMINATAYGVS